MPKPRARPRARYQGKDQAAPPLVQCPRCGWSTIHFGVLLRLHREWRALSATYCAGEIGLTAAAWSMWENGWRLPSEESVGRIGRLFNLSSEAVEELAQAAGLRLLPTHPGYRPVAQRGARVGV